MASLKTSAKMWDTLVTESCHGEMLNLVSRLSKGMIQQEMLRKPFKEFLVVFSQKARQCRILHQGVFIPEGWVKRV